MGYVLIGKIINTHGLKGELKIESHSDFDKDRYRKGSQVYVEYEGKMVPFTVFHYRSDKGFSFVQLEGNLDINLVEKYKGSFIYVDEKDRPSLKKGEYYRSDLIGLSAYDEEGNSIGEVIDVEETAGAQNNLRVNTGEKEVLIPYVPLFIKEVNLEEKKIVIHVLEGLL